MATRRKSKPRPPVTLTPEEEEREAKRKLKIAENKKKAAQQRSSEGRAAIIKEIRSAPNAKNCRCPIKPSMTLQEIVAIKTCTESNGGGPGWVCPVTDRIRRRLGH